MTVWITSRAAAPAPWVDALVAHGVLAAPLPAAESMPTAGTVVHVAVDGDLVSTGEAVHSLRSRLPGWSVWVCTRSLMPDDRALLRRVGADRVIGAPGPRPSDAADRIAAEHLAEAPVDDRRFGALIGGSVPMRQVWRHLEVLGPLDHTVLLQGEPGTGKELAAAELHRLRARGRFVAVNCALLDRARMQSDLFGHERGAFTGASERRPGFFQQAADGTLFLDEVGELDVTTQAGLLRVLQTGELQPVGSDKTLRSTARVVLATNRDLEHDTRSGRFQRDLLDRIGGYGVELPPLRARRSDLVLLAQHFLDRHNARAGTRLSLSEPAADSLFRGGWPGNVRQLGHVIERAAAYTTGGDGPVRADMIEEAVQRQRPRESGKAVRFDPLAETWDAVLERVRDAYFGALEEVFGADVQTMAERAGRSRSQVYDILRRRRERQS